MSETDTREREEWILMQMRKAQDGYKEHTMTLHKIYDLCRQQGNSQMLTLMAIEELARKALE